jgi:Zn-dependent protease with chaperone function
VFAQNETAIGRERELKADEAGAEASSPLALATSLIKVSLFAAFWPHAMEDVL